MSRHYTPLFEEICASGKMSDLRSDSARLLFVLLLPKCDRWGRMDARPRKVRALCWPLLKHDDDETAGCLADMERVGLVETYLDGEGQPYLCIPDWDEKAGAIGKRDHRGVSVWPDPSESTRAKPGQAGPGRAKPGQNGTVPGHPGPSLAGARARDPSLEESRGELEETGGVPPPARKRGGGKGTPLTRWWDHEWGRTRLDTTFAWTEEHAMALAYCAKLDGSSPEEVCKRITRFLEYPEEWAIKSANPLLLRKHWNRFAVEVQPTKRDALEEAIHLYGTKPA